MMEMKTIKAIVMALAFLMLVSVIASGATVSINLESDIHEKIERTYAPCDIEINSEYGEQKYFEPIEISLDVGEDVSSYVSMVYTGSSFVRQRQIEIHPIFYGPSDIPEETTIKLNLFNDATYTGRIRDSTEYFNGITGISGDIENSPFGYFTLTVENGMVYGKIEIPENKQTFVIQYESNSDKHL